VKRPGALSQAVYGAVLGLGLVACPREGTSDSGPQPGDVVSIDGATFAMGCDDCDGDEGPVHEVTLSSYTIDRFEVTVGEYAACVDEGACVAVADPSELANDLPRTSVSFDEAAVYCAWRGMSVPTEARWEYAARGDDGRRFPWGDAEPDCARAAQRACGGIDAVGMHPQGRSPFGVEDLAGNAWEWVSDYYAPDSYTTSEAIDPAGSATPGLRTVRGIDLWSDPDALRASNREYAIPDGRSALVGFRCAGEE
jgi:formylglycine-generating enzyme required for sulfatase activity